MISCRHAADDDRIYKKEALSLTQHGYRVTHVCYGGENRDYLTPDGVRIIEVRKKKRKEILLSPLALLRRRQMTDLFRAAASVQAKVYHLHDVELCRLARRLRNLPHYPRIVYDAHEPFVDNLLDYWRVRPLARVLLSDIPSLFAERFLLPRADYLIATEEHVAERFENHNYRTAVIYNYSFFEADPSAVSEHKIYDAIYAGLIAESKGIFLMINALSAAGKQGFRYRLVVVGAFESPHLERKVREAVHREALEEQVIFTGAIPIEALRDYYRKSRVAFCLFPSNRTNRKILPIKLFEYAAFGLPIIGSAFGHIEETIVHNQIGLTVDPLRSEDAAAALIRLLSGENYSSFSENGLHCVQASYRWEEQGRELIRIYEELWEQTRVV
jgi:glycosyltransferase involved in cell wall biosynthesis